MDFLTAKENRLLALYLKRMTFEDALRRCDQDTKENMKGQAYAILAAIEKVRDRLAAEGYAPR
jgi:ribosomal 50S subunit-associated protein YjgA (DUF615 family)